jgi:preprotein translocase subunit SecA
MAAAEDVVEELLDGYRQHGGSGGQGLTALVTGLKERLSYAPPGGPDSIGAMGIEELRSRINEDLRKDIEEKISEIGQENLNLFIRFEYLRQIDNRWQDHLESLEALREAVYLRAYSQKNPLLEYKLEGFQIFDTMLAEIRAAIARKIFQVRIRALEPRTRTRENFGDARHVLLGQFGGTGSPRLQPTGAAVPAGRAIPAAAARAPAGMGSRGLSSTASGERAEARPEHAQVRRSYPKVGRNEPCPCGSGKKYKYCHGQ